MKIHMQTWQITNGWLLALAGVLTAGQIRVAGADVPGPSTGTATVTVTAEADGAKASAGGSGGEQKIIVIKTIEPSAGEDQHARKDQAWLGVAIEEASEALASQLGLSPGVGLLVTYVAPDSPGAKAGLQKNDVLVEFDRQSLVHPAQLRKLVQVRKEGDAVELGFYRTGKKQTASVKLGKTPAGFGSLEDEQAWKGDLGALSRQLRDLPIGDTIRNQIKVYRDALGPLKLDQKKIQVEVQSSIEQARQALGDALRYSTNAASAAAAKALKELQRSGLLTDNNASVSVRSTEEQVSRYVRTDESGTIVIVSSPKPHLTAHDKDGKLLFDGEIGTPEQQSKVPPGLWEKVQPLLEKVAPKAEVEPGTAPPHSEGTSFHHKPAPVPMTLLGTRTL